MVVAAQSISQVTSYKRKYEIGSLPQILQRTTTSHAEITSVELLHGSLKATHLRNGKIRALSYGSMENVRSSPACFPSRVLIAVYYTFDSGRRKEYHMVSEYNVFSSHLFKLSISSSIIQDAESLRVMGLALVTYFYCDFRETKKQDVSGLLASLVAQLSAKSDACYSILSSLYSEFDAGSRRPGDDVLIDCLKKMLKIEGQPAIYIIIDAIDESPNHPGVVPPRERVLELVERLVHLRFANLRICMTSRPEADIQASLAPLSSHTISLHDQDGQKQDISDYVKSVVYSNRNMRRWKEKDKKMVIDILSQKADGM